MAKVGTVEAARLAGVDRSTLWRKCQTGALSFEVDGDGARLFDTAELERVFGPLQRPHPLPQPSLQREMHPPATDAAPGLLARLEGDLDRLRAELERERSERLDWQRRYVEAQDKFAALLTGPASPLVSPTPTQPGPVVQAVATWTAATARFFRDRWRDALRNAG